MSYPSTSALTTAWTTAWVTGASTGIGRELVGQLAAAGVHVAATARSSVILEDMAQMSPNIFAVPCDVTDRLAMSDAYSRIIAKFGRIDLAILNAGVWDQVPASQFDAARAAETLSVNYLGLANAVQPLVAEMIARKGGHIALVSSVAGYRGLPLAVYYGPSKAAAISLAEVLKGELWRHGVKVSVINPGFVETPMTARNEFPMPYIIKADDAARRIIRGLQKGKFEIVFPWQMMAMMKFARLLPYPVYFWLVRNVIAAQAEPDK